MNRKNEGPYRRDYFRPAFTILGSLSFPSVHYHPLLSRPDRAQPGALRAASGRGRGWDTRRGPTI